LAWNPQGSRGGGWRRHR